MLRNPQINIQDVISKQRYLRGFLSEHLPDVDLTDGSLIDDVVVKSLAYIMALFDVEAQNIKSMLSVGGIAESEDVTAVQLMDDLASNFFVSRNDGDFARGVVRVVVSTNSRGFLITPFTLFTKTPGVTFYYSGGVDGETNLEVTTEDLLPELDSSGAETGNFYFDVAVLGEIEGLGSELAPGVFEGVSPSIPNLVKLHNYAPFSVSAGQETNNAFSSRIVAAITNRGFNSVTGIETYLIDAIPLLKSVKAIGAASSLMKRDLLRLDGATTVTTTFRTLGKCNIYYSLGLSPLEKSIQVTIPAYAEADQDSLHEEQVSLGRVCGIISQDLTVNLVSKFIDIQGEHFITLVNNFSTGLGADYVSSGSHVEFTYLDPTLDNAVNTSGYLYARTKNQSMAVKVPNRLAETTGGTVSLPGIKFLVADATELVETELALEENDVPGLDTLGYSYNVKLLKVSIKYFKSPDAPGEVPEAFIRSDLAKFINNFSQQSLNITKADIVRYILDEYSAYVSGVDSSELYMEMSIFLPDGTNCVFEVGNSTTLSSTMTRPYFKTLINSVESKTYNFLPDSYLEDLQVGDSSCVVHTEAELITFEEAT